MAHEGARSSLFRFFSNPAVGILGSLASIIGLILAIYFYILSTRHRELSYLVHPAKAIVIKAGQTSRINVIFDGKKLERDVTAAQVAFWNSGNEAIRREHVLQAFVIRTDKDHPIIDARIRKRSRGVIDLALDTRNLATGELGVSWDILEQNDGGVVQVVFLGSPDVKISATAVVEGQPKLFEATPGNPLGRWGNWAFIVLGSVILIMIGILVSVSPGGQHRPGLFDRFVNYIFIPASSVFGLVMLVSGIVWASLLIGAAICLLAKSSVEPGACSGCLPAPLNPAPFAARRIIGASLHGIRGWLT